MLWMLLAIPLVAASDSDGGRTDFMYFIAFMLLIGFCVVGIWAASNNDQPRVIRAEIVLPRREHRESYEAC